MEANWDDKENMVIQFNLFSKWSQFICWGKKQQEGIAPAPNIFIYCQCFSVSPPRVTRDIPCHIAEDIFPNAAGMSTGEEIARVRYMCTNVTNISVKFENRSLSFTK